MNGQFSAVILFNLSVAFNTVIDCSVLETLFSIYDNRFCWFSSYYPSLLGSSHLPNLNTGLPQGSFIRSLSATYTHFPNDVPSIQFCSFKSPVLTFPLNSKFLCLTAHSTFPTWISNKYLKHKSKTKSLSFTVSINGMPSF